MKPRFHMSNFGRVVTIQMDEACVEFLKTLTEVYVENVKGAEEDEVLHAFRSKLDLHSHYITR